MNKITKIFMIVFLTVSLVGISLSAKGPREGKRGGPCAEDIQKFCDGAKGSEAQECLEKNKDNLSTECKAMQEKVEKFKKACEADVKKFCSKDTATKKGHPMRCLMKNRNNLSKECKAALPKKPERKIPTGKKASQTESEEGC